MRYTRRDLLRTFIALGGVAAAPWPLPWMEPAETCDGCGLPEALGEPLAYCIDCDAILHHRCAASRPCQPTSIHEGWREMFEAAVPDLIAADGGHPLIVARLQIVR